jgi:hypothetical protein|nr:MAG TPA: hypothetical protein [Caudoviricetes sp.]
MEYASKGVAGTGLGLGIAGTALGLLNGGVNGAGLLGASRQTSTAGDMASIVSAVADVAGLNKCSDNTPVTRFEMKMQQTLSEKDAEIALLKSEQNTEVKIADVYERLITRINADQRAQADWNANQSVANAQMSAAIATNNASIASLQNCCNQITKLVVPNSAICPGWGNVTITPSASTTTTG